VEKVFNQINNWIGFASYYLPFYDLTPPKPNCYYLQLLQSEFANKQFILPTFHSFALLHQQPIIRTNNQPASTQPPHLPSNKRLFW
jgi:hypothetical protein